jgi:hypothetical protein
MCRRIERKTKAPPRRGSAADTMSTEEPMNLETEGDGAVAFSVMLERISKRPDSHCKWAYDFFDDRQDGATTEIVNNFAALGWNTKQIYEQFKKHMPQESINWPERMHEMVALEIEWAVRRAAL